jgi:hypothetical protein
MVEPITIALVTVLSERAAAAVVAGGRSAWVRLVRLIREKLAGRKEESKIPAELPVRRADPAQLELLACSLGRALHADPTFSDAVHAVQRRAEVDLAAADQRVSNHVSGTVHGQVIQAQSLSVQGDLLLGGTSVRLVDN